MNLLKLVADSCVLLLVIVTLVNSQRNNSTRRNTLKRKVRHIRDGTIRLVGGHTKAEGNVEIYHAGKWGSICDDEWDLREANMVCKVLGYGKAIRATYSSEFGRGRRFIWMDNLYCEGSENGISDCRFDGWGVHDCTSTEAAGVVCSQKNQSAALTATVAPNDTPLPKTKLKLLSKKDISIRLLGGRNSLEGRIEVKIADQDWGIICGDGWGMLESMVVCKQLNFGYAQAAIQSSFFGGHPKDMILSGVKCTGEEKSLDECVHDMFGRVFCPGKEENIAGVICAKEMADLVPDEQEIERSAYLEDRQLLFLQCAMEENCLGKAAYDLDRNDYGWHYEQRRLLRFTARIANIGTADFRPFLPKYTWQWHMCHLHYHSMEVFAHFDIMDLQGKKMAEGHKASFCLEDSHCLANVEKKYACANYGDQGITPGCTDTYLHNIDCQWIDISELTPGIYRFKVAINPEFKVAESNFSNNAVTCTLYYNAISARLVNCTLGRP